MARKKKRVDIGNADTGVRSNYSDTLAEIIADGFCPFCEAHLTKHHKNPILLKGKYWLVTKNAWPYEGARFHFLFIARSHVENIESVKPPMWQELQTLYKKLVRIHNLSGATLLLRSGETGLTGASVNHLHAHLVVGSKRTKKTTQMRATIGFKK